MAMSGHVAQGQAWLKPLRTGSHDMVLLEDCAPQQPCRVPAARKPEKCLIGASCWLKT